MTNEQTVLEFFNERAAIMEHDGGLSRTMAELKAIDETRDRFGAGWINVIRQKLEKRK